MQERFGKYRTRHFSNIEEVVLLAYRAKLLQNPQLIKMIRECTLPFTIYYTNTLGLIIDVCSRQYIVDFLEAFRTHIRHAEPETFVYVFKPVTDDES